MSELEKAAAIIEAVRVELTADEANEMPLAAVALTELEEATVSSQIPNPLQPVSQHVHDANEVGSKGPIDIHSTADDQERSHDGVPHPIASTSAVQISHTGNGNQDELRTTKDGKGVDVVTVQDDQQTRAKSTEPHVGSSKLQTLDVEMGDGKDEGDADGDQDQNGDGDGDGDDDGEGDGNDDAGASVEDVGHPLSGSLQGNLEPVNIRPRLQLSDMSRLQKIRGLAYEIGSFSNQVEDDPSYQHMKVIHEYMDRLLREWNQFQDAWQIAVRFSNQEGSLPSSMAPSHRTWNPEHSAGAETSKIISFSPYIHQRVKRPRVLREEDFLRRESPAEVGLASPVIRLRESDESSLTENRESAPTTTSPVHISTDHTLPPNHPGVSTPKSGSGYGYGLSFTSLHGSVDVIPRPRQMRLKSRPGLFCRMCGVTETPEWRSGPQGAVTLCNACGIQYSKLKRRQTTRIKHVDPEKKLVFVRENIPSGEKSRISKGAYEEESEYGSFSERDGTGTTGFEPGSWVAGSAAVVQNSSTIPDPPPKLQSQAKGPVSLQVHSQLSQSQTVASILAQSSAGREQSKEILVEQAFDPLLAVHHVALEALASKVDVISKPPNLHSSVDVNPHASGEKSNLESTSREPSTDPLPGA